MRKRRRVAIGSPPSFSCCVSRAQFSGFSGTGKEGILLRSVPLSCVMVKKQELFLAPPQALRPGATAGLPQHLVVALPACAKEVTVTETQIDAD